MEIVHAHRRSIMNVHSALGIMRQFRRTQSKRLGTHVHESIIQITADIYLSFRPSWWNGLSASAACHFALFLDFLQHASRLHM